MSQPSMTVSEVYIKANEPNHPKLTQLKFHTVINGRDNKIHQKLQTKNASKMQLNSQKSIKMKEQKQKKF